MLIKISTRRCTFITFRRHR